MIMMMMMYVLLDEKEESRRAWWDDDDDANVEWHHFSIHLLSSGCFWKYAAENLLHR